MPRTFRSRPENRRAAGTRGGVVPASPEVLVPSDTKLPHVGEIGRHVRGILAALGEDPAREGLLKTPERVEKSLRFLTRGYREDIDRLLNRALFAVEYDEMVIIKDIDVFSLCEHHVLPFFGRAHVAYIPRGRVIGLSKIPRLVDAFARRLQVQERLTVQIAEAIQDSVQPGGVGVVIEAMHFCMIMRGVEKQSSVAVTSCMLGSFRDRPQTREEFLALIRKKSDSLG